MGRPLKDGKITLTEEEKKILTKIRKSKTETAIRVKRATMLLLSDEGKTLVDIASKLDFHFSAVKLCLTKYRKGGIEGALNDEKGRGRKAVITDEDKAWIKNIACKKPADFGYAQELWSIRKLREHIINNCENEKHEALKTVSISTLSVILNEASIKPHRIRYYLEKRDEDFEKKMEEVLIVYKKVQMKLEKKLEDEYIMVSYDEKPGIQAIGNTVADKHPTEKHGFIARDSEYKRLGTLSLLAGINLLDGEVISIIRNRHASEEFIEWLKVVDEKYDKDKKILVVLDNHSVHRSKKTNEYLETRKERFEFVFTPKHGSWLNIIEGFFGKLARQLLRGIRVKSKEELVERITKYIAEVNENPVIPNRIYKMDETTIL
ncbi:IS630 family transposase [Treponema sp.]|uniref:IS630 family transposase n=1 Tax=Treponema sp. TaxID=166 RepID=UPI003F0C3650